MLSPVGVELVSDSWRIGRMRSREIDGDRPRGMKGSFHLFTALQLFIFTSLTLRFLFSSISISAPLLHVEFLYLIILISVSLPFIPISEYFCFILYILPFLIPFFQFMPLASIIPFLNTPILLPGIAFPLHLVHFILSLHPLVLLFLGNVQFNVQCNPPAVMLLCQSECGKCVSVQLFVHTVVVVFYCLVILFQFLNVASCNLAGKESKMFPLDKSKTLSIIWV